jgi:hypothetical protein
LILGKFKKKIINQIQENNFFEIINNFNLIPIENFFEIFKSQSKEYIKFRQSLKLLELIAQYQNIFKENIELLLKLNNFIKTLNLTINYSLLSKYKARLISELEISKFRNISSDIAAKTDLLNKLNDSITQNKNKLNYRKQDFVFIKNQRDQVLNNINEYKLKIQEFNNAKKSVFNQINKISRNLEKVSTDQDSKKDLDISLDNNNDLSQSEKIKSLQKQVKEIQYEINQTNLKINETQLKLNEITPNYEILEKDYQSLVYVIENDELRLKEIKSDLEKKLGENEPDLGNKFEINKINSLRSSQEIENEIVDINTKLTKISEHNTYLNHNNPLNLSEILNELKNFDKDLDEKINNITLSFDNKDILNYFDNFRKLEIAINELKDILNKFLLQINLNIDITSIISDNLQNLVISLIFIRDNKEKFNFEDLTTPEKIFFIICFYISIKILTKSKNIIFSNLFISSEYNKRGSVYRTISRILPIFEHDKDLKDYSLIFIISNLEMKNPIENIKIIKIENK